MKYYKILKYKVPKLWAHVGIVVVVIIVAYYKIPKFKQLVHGLAGTIAPGTYALDPSFGGPAPSYLTDQGGFAPDPTLKSPIILKTVCHCPKGYKQLNSLGTDPVCQDLAHPTDNDYSLPCNPTEKNPIHYGTNTHSNLKI